MEWAGVLWNGLGSIGMDWSPIAWIGFQLEWIEVQSKSSEPRTSLNSKICFLNRFFVFPPKTFKLQPNVGNSRSNLNGLRSIGMDWGPMFMFCLVLGALYVLEFLTYIKMMVCDVSGRLKI